MFDSSWGDMFNLIHFISRSRPTHSVFNTDIISPITILGYPLFIIIGLSFYLLYIGSLADLKPVTSITTNIFSEVNVDSTSSNVSSSLIGMGIFSRLNSYWSTGILALSIYVLKILNPSIFSKLYLISISQYLLFWTIWILFVVFYYIFILYALYRGHVKITLGVDPVMDDKSSKFIPKFIVNHYNQWHNLGSSNYIPYFEMFFRSLMVAIGIVSINILICIVLSFY